MADSLMVFKSAHGKLLSEAAYEVALKNWPVEHEELDVVSRFGPTHIIACGPVNGQPLILLHGQEASATMWLYNVQDLSRKFRVYAVDTIGDIGKSRPEYFPKSRADYAAWLLDVLDQLHLVKVHLVGMSYGGFLALNFSIACPARVKKTVLLAPGIPNFGPPTFRWAFYGLPMLAFPSRHTIKRFIKGASWKGYSAQDPVHEQMMVGVPNLREPNFLRPVFTDEELRQIHTPCLLLVGDHEIMYDPVKALQRANRLIPNLEVEMVAGAGHFLNSDQPGVVDDRILKFLNGTPN